MRNSKKKNYCLIAALASLVAFSTMAASVMSGCGENSDEQKTTKIVHETRIDTQIETKIETYTEVVTDAQGHTEYVEETKNVIIRVQIIKPHQKQKSPKAVRQTTVHQKRITAKQITAIHQKQMETKQTTMAVHRQNQIRPSRIHQNPRAKHLLYTAKNII